jgi:hypothetical protein
MTAEIKKLLDADIYKEEEKLLKIANICIRQNFTKNFSKKAMEREKVGSFLIKK